MEFGTFDSREFEQRRKHEDEELNVANVVVEEQQIIVNDEVV